MFTNQVTQIITGDLSKNDFANKLIAEIKNCAGLKSEQASFEPFIRNFANEFYLRILRNPSYSPFLIVQKITEDGEKTRKLIELKSEKDEGRFDSFEKGIHEIKEGLFQLQDKQGQMPRGVEATPQIDPTQLPSDIRQTERFPYAERYVMREFDTVLRKLNEFFKDRTEVVKSIQKQRDYKRAIELYESLLLKAYERIDDAVLYGIYVDCALCSINIDDLNLAEKWLNKAEGLNIEDEKVISVRGLHFYEKGDEDKADELADKALKINSNYHIALMLKVVISLKKGIAGHILLNNYFLDGEDNIKNTFKPDHLSITYRTIGQCYLKDGDLDKAIVYFERCLELDNADDGCIALLGNAYFRKATGPVDIIPLASEFPESKKELLRTAISHFHNALQLAAKHKALKNHPSTLSNLSTCYLILGEYDTAYDVTNEINLSIKDTEEVIRSRAAAAYYKEFYAESSELLKRISSKTAQDVINNSLSEIKAGNIERALIIIADDLNKEALSPEDHHSIQALKFQILIVLNKTEDAYKELQAIVASNLPRWEISTMQGSYSALINDDTEADKHFKEALEDKEITAQASLFIANYYFRNRKYEACQNICISIKDAGIGKIGSKADIKIYFWMAIISSYELKKYKECRAYINRATKRGIDENYIYEILASICWHEAKYEEAKDNLIEIYNRTEEEEKKLAILANLISLLTISGDFREIQEYYEEVHDSSNFYKNERLTINLIIAFIVLGNLVEAKSIFDKAVAIHFDNKDSEIHKFAPYFYMRENKADLFARYAIEFNRKHGDTDWLWKKDVKENEQELRNLFVAGIKEERTIKKLYKMHPIPFISLSVLLRKRELIHFWRFNKEYGYIFHSESGREDELVDECKTIKKERKIIIDYISLLAIQEVSPHLLWVLDKYFDTIYMYRPLQLRMIEELIAEEHMGLREIIKFLSSSKKIEFIGRYDKDLSDLPKEIKLFVDTEHAELLQVAKGKQLCVLSADVQFRGICKNLQIKTFGLRAFFETARIKNIIGTEELYAFTIAMIKKKSQFISFNHELLVYLFSKFPFQEARHVFEKLNSQILLKHSNIDSFTKVYAELLQTIISQENNLKLVKYIIKSTLTYLKRLTVKSLLLIEHSYIFPEEEYVTPDMKTINSTCLRYLFNLLKIIYTSSLADALKDELEESVIREFNLAHWYTLRNRDELAINSAIRQARELRPR